MMKKNVLFLFLLSLLCGTDLQAQRQKIDLQGSWMFCLDADDRGVENNFALQPFDDSVTLPGTTDTNKKGVLNEKKDETTYLSRIYSYVGKAWYKRSVTIPKDWKGKVVTLNMERTKPTQVWVDGKEAGRNDDICTPQVYDLSLLLTPGKHEITVMVDNGKSVPEELLASSHAYTESTQTNWNGIIGELYLEAKNRLHISDVQLYPDATAKLVRVKVRLASPERIRKNDVLTLNAESWNTAKSVKVMPIECKLTKNRGDYEFEYFLGEDARLWSEFTPVLYRLDVEIRGIDKQSLNFGLRDFRVEGTQFAINGDVTFLRGKHDACVFPLTAHVAMDVESWQHYFKVAKSYGINHYRFHSWCPPRACFEAADIEGIYLQPELPFWGWLGREKTQLVSFLRKEGINIQLAYGNHASFVMFALGNELSGDADTMKSLIATFRQTDGRHLYAYGSNNFLGFNGFIPGQDYLTTCRIGGEQPQSFDTHTRGSFSFADAYDGGYINHCYPNTQMDFTKALTNCPVPVISHETGQFQIYPDYNEIAKYKGVLYPHNMELFRSRLQKAGMSDLADDFFKASGLWSVELYKADIEMDLRTAGFGGFQLLDLQDYPGQGSAYIGILDAFMDSKGLVSPERWRGFCCEVVPLLIIEKFCWTNNEKMAAQIRIANYLPNSLKGKELVWKLKNEQGGVIDEGSLTITSAQKGLFEAGTIHPDLSSVAKAMRLNLEIKIAGTAYVNAYSLWIYPQQEQLTASQITITDELDSVAIGKLRSGGKVLWFPKRERLEDLTVGGLFQTDYWNYRMFKSISENNHQPVSPGTLGILTNPHHPIFNDFPTDSHTNWQWFSIIKHSYPLILDKFPDGYKPIVQVIDNIERNHKLGLIFELNIDRGKLLVCMCNLESVGEMPEVRQFYNSMVSYMLSQSFVPQLTLSADSLMELLNTEISGQRTDPVGSPPSSYLGAGVK